MTRAIRRDESRHEEHQHGFLKAAQGKLRDCGQVRSNEKQHIHHSDSVALSLLYGLRIVFPAASRLSTRTHARHTHTHTHAARTHADPRARTHVQAHTQEHTHCSVSLLFLLVQLVNAYFGCRCLRLDSVPLPLR